MARIDFESVTKVYPGPVRALDRLCLMVEDGEFVVIVGPSGCGKSTALKLLAGLEEVSEGVVRLDGRVVNRVAPRDRDLAMVFQDSALYPHLTVYNNMAFGLRFRGLARPEIDRRVRETASLLGIVELLRRKPRTLSGGQRQRVALARAIVRRPRAFLLDEPLSNLDAALRVEMRTELKRLHREIGVTALYVTHDQEEAMMLGERIAVMEDGEIRQCAPPLEVYEHPVDRFVAGFIGTPAMNFLDGRVVRRDGVLEFEEGSNRLTLPDGLRERLVAREGQALVLGFRPESVSDRRESPGTCASQPLRVRITMVEPLGDRKDVHVATQSHKGLVARLDASIPTEEGADMALYLDMSRVHLFEPGAHGRNIGLDGLGAGSSAN